MMQKKELVYSSKSPIPSSPYSPAIIADNFVFVSGQGPTDPLTGNRPEGIEAQTKAVIEKIESLLIESGSDLSHIVKTTVFLSNLEDYAGMNKVYQELIPEPYPSRSTIGVKLLENILVEIEVVAQIK